MKSGLIGCVHSLKIGHHSVNLLGFEDGDLVTDSEAVTECQKSCSNDTCGCSGTVPASCARRWELGLRPRRRQHLFVAGDIIVRSFIYCYYRLLSLGDECYDDNMACTSEPCSFGSTCESLPGGRYACFCLPGLTGVNCDKCKTVRNPFVHINQALCEWNCAIFRLFLKQTG